MKARDAYLAAAEQFANQTNVNSGCCDVLTKIVGNYERAYHLPELLLFRPKKNEEEVWWWERHDREIRVLALCFMAAIAESEGD